MLSRCSVPFGDELKTFDIPQAAVKETPKPPPIKPAAKTVPVQTVVKKKACSTPTKVPTYYSLCSHICDHNPTPGRLHNLRHDPERRVAHTLGSGLLRDGAPDDADGRG